MIRLSLNIVLLLIANAVIGQVDTSFYAAIGDIGYEYGKDIVSFNEDFVIVGRRESNPERQSDGYIFRINRKGEIIWSFAVGENGIDSYEAAAILPSGKIVSVGYTNSYENMAYQSMFAIHDTNGELLNLQFQQNSNNWEFSRDVYPSNNGGFIVTGERFLDDGTTDIWVGSYNQSGELLWISSYGSQWNDGGTSLVQTPSGKIFVAGYSSDQSVQYPVILELDSNGDSLSIFTYQVQESGQWNDITFTSTSNLVVAGQNYVSGEDWNLLRASFDTNLVEFWSEELGGPDDDKWNSVDELYNGNLVFAGYSFSSIGAGNYDAFFGIYEFDNDFVHLTTQGGTEVDQILNVIAADSGAVMIGNTNSFGSGLDDVYFIRMAKNGMVSGNNIAVVDDVFTIQTSVNETPKLTSFPIRLYPIPAKDILTIEMESLNEIRIQIVTINGTLVREVFYHGKRSQLDISSLAPGSYLLKIISNSQIETRLIQKY